MMDTKTKKWSHSSYPTDIISKIIHMYGLQSPHETRKIMLAQGSKVVKTIFGVKDHLYEEGRTPTYMS